MMAAQMVKELCHHRPKEQNATVKNVNDNLTASSHSKNANEFFSFLPSQQQFKRFCDRLVACNGDCGSKLSKIIFV